MDKGRIVMIDHPSNSTMLAHLAHKLTLAEALVLVAKSTDYKEDYVEQYMNTHSYEPLATPKHTRFHGDRAYTEKERRGSRTKTNKKRGRKK